MRKIGVVLAIVAGGAAFLLLYMYSVALRDPVVRQTSIGLADWPRGSAAIRVVLLTDPHVGGPDMPPERLARIVAQVNALKPDLVLLGGDFVSDKRSSTKHFSGIQALAPFSAIKARLGAVAVFGNHDHWRGLPDIRAGLGGAHIRLLQNEAISIGPLSLGETDDAFTGNDNVRATVDAMRRHVGARVLLSHSPDVVPGVSSDVTLILAGHTHCGQIRLPLIGAVSTMSKYGEHFACSLSSDGPKRVITSAGLGTSIVPLRLGGPAGPVATDLET